MDFVLNKLDAHVAVSMDMTVEKQTLMRERIEYMLYQILGCLWNDYFKQVSQEKKKKLVENLKKMSIGEVVGAIRNLDEQNMYISKKELKIFDEYPKLRNETMGHGFVHQEGAKQLEKDLEELYGKMLEFEFYKKEYDVVLVMAYQDGIYTGVRISQSEPGLPKRWSCPEKVFDATVGDTFLLAPDSCCYHRISPFISIQENGEKVYVFGSLEDKLSGKVDMNRLFATECIHLRISEFICMSTESDRRRISPNGTIMNYYDQNYEKYITVPLEKNIKNFLRNNKSNVQATVWGHGGVGKTACVQNICMELFNGEREVFSYIIFVSAKDRRYETTTGTIEGISDRIRSYQEILDTLISVVFDEEPSGDIQEKENRILEISHKVLLVVDDYETFEDIEKERIQAFIAKLDLNNFKVIITTRNKRFSTGIEIRLDELDEEATKNFLKEIFQNNYPDRLQEVADLISDKKIFETIYNATSGRPLLLYQFANLYVQKGMSNVIARELRESDNAKDFLYGRIYQYLGKVAKEEFAVISQIIDEEALIFKEEILLYLFNDYDKESVADGLQELMEQKIIEQYDDDNYRVYSHDMFDRMLGVYNGLDESYKDKIRNKLRTIGGKNIKGTVYEAMLEEANASRFKGNVKDTLQQYKHILNEKDCDQRIKKRALLNLTSYISINLMDNEQTISVFEDYIDKLGFREDVTVINMYVQYLWRSDDVAKTKACDILERFFRSKAHRKLDKKYFELFTIAVNYCSHNVMDNTPDKVKAFAESRIMNEYGEWLFNGVKNRTYNEFKPSVRHNIALALVATTKLGLDLCERGYDRKQLVDEIIQYGEKNFNEIFKRQLEHLSYKTSRKEKDGETVEARITYIARYGLLVEIQDLGKAIIHNTEMDQGQRQGLKVGDTIQAIIVGQNEKGYILSTKTSKLHNA